MEQTEDSVDDVVRLFHGSREIIGEWNREGFELCCKTLRSLVYEISGSGLGLYLIEIVLALFWVVDGWLVSVVPKVSCSDEPISSFI